MYARVEISLYSSSSNLCVRGSLDELRHLPCLCAGGPGAAFALAGCWGRVSPAQAASPRHPVSLSLAWNSSVLGELSRGGEQEEPEL